MTLSRCKKVFCGGSILVLLLIQLGLIQEIRFNYNQNTIWKQIAANNHVEHDYPFTFAACLLTKDDNQKLPEWLAYHYTVLPLRYLIVAVDPLSLTSPDHLFDLYRGMGMHIEAWHGNEYLRDRKRGFDPNNKTNDQLYHFYRWRQTEFLKACLHELKKENKTWTLLVDSDEYLTYNNYLTYENTTAKKLKQEENHTYCPSKVPQIIGKQNETIAHFISSGADPTFFLQDKPCIVYSRTLFGSRESSPDNISEEVPDGFNISLFDTIRYQTPAYGKMWPGKSLVDVSRYNNQEVNVHFALRDECYNNAWVHSDEMCLRVHHYTGSMENFLSRPGDLSRTAENFLERNTYKSEGNRDKSMIGWLKEFVKLVGKEKALETTEIAHNDAYIETTKLNDDLRKGKNMTAVYEWKNWRN